MICDLFLYRNKLFFLSLSNYRNNYQLSLCQHGSEFYRICDFVQRFFILGTEIACQHELQ